MTGKFNNCVTGNSEGSGKFCGVAKFVFNFECNGMFASTESNVTFGRKCISCDSCLYFNTVNNDFTGGKIKCCFICNGCGECNFISVDHSSVIKRNCGIGGGISRIGDGRKYSVINSGAVVESDIINIESKFCRSSGFYVGTQERGRANIGCSCDRIHCRQIYISRNINRHIYPSGFRNICFSTRIKILSNS